MHDSLPVLFDQTIFLLLKIFAIFSNAGDVRFWDPRFTESVRTLNLTQGITALEIHKHADVLAWLVSKFTDISLYLLLFSQANESVIVKL